jgi:hypothetical protein
MLHSFGKYPRIFGGIAELARSEAVNTAWKLKIKRVFNPIL